MSNRSFRGWLVAIALGLSSLFLVACDREYENVGTDVASSPQWQIVESPISGRCYEVLSWSYHEAVSKAYGFAGMAEVACPGKEE